MKKTQKAPSKISQETFKTLKKELEEAKEEIASLTETSKRALADLANFKRRTEEERKAFIEFANAILIQEILQITDNFERAFAHTPNDLKENEWVQGIVHIEKQLTEILQKQGVKEIEALGKPIDPNLHDAMMTGPGEKNIVIEVLEKGYMLGNKVVRHAKVKVGEGS